MHPDEAVLWVVEGQGDRVVGLVLDVRFACFIHKDIFFTVMKYIMVFWVIQV